MIGFRVDANEYIATGHLMRCMAIAEACKKQGEKCLFFLAEKKETKRLQEHNLPYRILNTQWNDLEAEVSVLKKLLVEEQITRLVVDSYQATPDYLSQLNACVPILYIDDIGEEFYDISAVLHYSVWPGDYSYEKKYALTDVNVLLGMKYVPLRDEFLKNNTERKRENSILITTGGTDPFDVTGQLLEKLIKNNKFKDYLFHVIVGSMNQNEEALKSIASEDARVLLHKDVKNMADYMKTCSFAVSAGGMTLYELCACGIPTVCFSFADNQEEFVNKSEQQRIMISAGDVRKDAKCIQKICEGLILYLENPDIKVKYTERMKKLVDGQGANRIARYLCEKTN